MVVVFVKEDEEEEGNWENGSPFGDGAIQGLDFWQTISRLAGLWDVCLILSRVSKGSNNFL